MERQLELQSLINDFDKMLLVLKNYLIKDGEVNMIDHQTQDCVTQMEKGMQLIRLLIPVE
jgi:hypothetical protein